MFLNRVMFGELACALLIITVTRDQNRPLNKWYSNAFYVLYEEVRDPMAESRLSN